MLDTQERGQLVETVVFNHTLRLGFNIDFQTRKYGYYWSDESSERDIILDLRNKFKFVVPIEVKNGQCGPQDKKKMRITIHNVNAPFGIIVCNDALSLEGNVLTIPAWLFLLSC